MWYIGKPMAKIPPMVNTLSELSVSSVRVLNPTIVISDTLSRWSLVMQVYEDLFYDCLIPMVF